MSQHDMILDDAPGQPFRLDLNAALQALASLNAGPTEPATKYPSMLWLDTSVLPNGALKMRSLANASWTSVPLADAPAVRTGTGAGDVITTGNIASTTVDAATTIFPIGTTILAYNVTANSRTVALPVRIYTTSPALYECNTGTGALLAGTWRTRGRVVIGASNYSYLMQRTA